MPELISNQLHAITFTSIEISEISFEGKYKDQLGKFDNIIDLNVIEHIEDYCLALIN